MHITSKLIHNHHQKRNNNWNPRSSNIFRIMQAGKLKTNNSTPKKRENIDTKNQYNSSRLLPPFIYSLHQTEVSSQEESKRGKLNFKHTDDQSNHDHFKLKKINNRDRLTCICSTSCHKPSSIWNHTLSKLTTWTSKHS